MATRLPKSADAVKTIGRGKPDESLFLTDGSLFHCIHGEPARRGCLKRGSLHSEVDM